MLLVLVASTRKTRFELSNSARVILTVSVAVIGLQDYGYDPLILRNHVIAVGALVAVQGALIAAYGPGVAALTIHRKDALD